jgi:hypothetical protein
VLLEIIRRVKKVPTAAEKAFRPSDMQLPIDQANGVQRYNEVWSKLMEFCWQEEPDNRPTVADAAIIIRQICGGR